MKKSILLVFILLCAALPLFIQTSYAGTPAGTITYSAGTDTITVVGANSSHPAEFLDLYNADVSGGWGQVTKQGNQYIFYCKLQVGNGSALTYFTDTNKEIWVDEAAVTANSQTWCMVKGNATVTIGTLTDYASKRSSGGCTFGSNFATYYYPYIFNNDAPTANITLYSSTFYAGSKSAAIRGGSASIRIWNSIITQNVYLTLSVDAYNTQCHSYNGYFLSTISNPVLDTIRVVSSVGALSLSGDATGTANLSVRGIYARGNTRLGTIGNRAYDTYFIDCDSDTWSFLYTGTNTGEIYRQTSFNLFVLNGDLTDFVEDANVTLTHDGTVYGSWLANSTGQIPTQTLTYGFYNQTGGNTMYGGTPWTLTITHPNWQTYTSTFYPYSKIEWSISMQDTSTANNNILLSGLFVGVLCFAGFIVYARRN